MFFFKGYTQNSAPWTLIDGQGVLEGYPTRESLLQANPGAFPVVSGRRDGERGEAWVLWWVLPPTVTGEDLEAFLGAFARGPGSGNPGGVFHAEPWVRRGAGRVLVTQRGGFDV